MTNIKRKNLISRTLICAVILGLMAGIFSLILPKLSKSSAATAPRIILANNVQGEYQYIEHYKTTRNNLFGSTTYFFRYTITQMKNNIPKISGYLFVDYSVNQDITDKEVDSEFQILVYDSTTESRDLKFNFNYVLAPTLIVSDNVTGILYSGVADTYDGLQFLNKFICSDIKTLTPKTIAGYTFVRTETTGNAEANGINVKMASNSTVHHIYTRDLPTTPSKEGHTFTGWYLDETCTIKYTNQIIGGDTQLYAGWQINIYTVTFNKNNDTSADIKTVNYNTVVTAPTVTRTGYTFGGWYTDSGFTNSFSLDTPIKSNTTLYAKWTINIYTVNFVTNCDATLNPVTIEYNTAVTQPTIERVGYMLTGWFTDAGFVNPYDFNTLISENKTLYANWTIIKYNVLFRVNNGGEDITQLILYQNKATEPTISKEGYIFNGWFTDAVCTEKFNFDTVVTDNLQLYAGWEIKQYTVTFIVDGVVYHTFTAPHGSILEDTSDGVTMLKALGGTAYTDIKQTNAFSGAIIEDTILYGSLTPFMAKLINFGNWVFTYWWVILLIVIAVIALIGGIIIKVKRR